jgi:AcrR family transcriptional regulator
MPRKYRLNARAKKQEGTRQRIIEAIARLHAQVGPAATTVSAIAEVAGVERLTVYRHFPTNASMFQACGAHWRTLHPRPDTEAWLKVADPTERLTIALLQLYQFYDETEHMSANILRDEQVLPELAAVANFHGWLMMATDRICEAWAEEDRPRTRPAVRLAIDFNTWQLLVRRMGLDPGSATTLVCKMVHQPQYEQGLTATMTATHTDSRGR